MEASGAWLRSLEVRGSDIYGAKYTEQLVFGRKPGKLPPIKEIEKWVNVKLKIYGRAATKAAWAISKKIAEKGTSWYQKGGSNLLEVLDEPQTVAYVHSKVGAWYRVQVANELRRYAKDIFEQ